MSQAARRAHKLEQVVDARLTAIAFLLLVVLEESARLDHVVDLVVQLTRLRDGSRRVSQVTEFVDYDEAEQTIRTKDLFLLDEASGDAVLTPTGSLPTFMGDLIAGGLIRLDAFYL